MKLIVDVTYVGAVSIESRIDLDHDHVAAVLWSLSKPFGVYYHRIGGILSRGPIPTLRGHHWFKNLFSVLLGQRLLETYAPRELPLLYKPVQADVIERARKAGEIADLARASDVVMLAHAPPGDTFTEYARGERRRFCLSPGMDQTINP